MDEESKRVVRGEIVLPDSGTPVKAADVVVRVEDVSRADAPSIVVGEHHFREIQLADGAAIPFSVDVPAGLIDDRASYSVSAHVDVSGSGRVERGDLITMESYPVLTRGLPSEARVRVRRV